MLIDKGISEGEIVTIKLTSGEEIIAKLIEENAETYKLSKAMVLSMGPQGIGMMPYLITVNPEKDFKLFKSTVTVISVTDRQFSDQYVQATTGLKLS